MKAADLGEANQGRPPLAIIGGGRVGQTLGKAWRDAGWPVVMITCRSEGSARVAAAFTGVPSSTDDPAAARAATVLVVSTADDDVAGAVEGMAGAGALGGEHIVLHTSGALGLDALSAAKRAGAATGSIHPIHSFPRPEPDAERLSGIVWGVTADVGALPVARALVRDAGGLPVEVREDDRAVYHAAAAVASNATVGVLDFALTLLGSCGFADEEARSAMTRLARGTVDNVAALGAVEALTGPIVRGDQRTVERHLEALEGRDPEWAHAYRALGRLVLATARKRGLDEEVVRKMSTLLGSGPAPTPQSAPGPKSGSSSS